MRRVFTFIFFTMFSIITIVGCSKDSKRYMTGLYLKSTNENRIIIDEKNGPIVMSNNTDKENIFDDLKNGDKIEVTFDLINETYPGKTQIYSLRIIERGNEGNIPKETINRLQEMGWSFDLSY